MYTYEAKVIRVIDGDTAVLSVSLGFNIYHEIKVRFFEINAPELKTKKGKEVKAWLKELIEGKEVKLISKGIGKYGRCLGIIEFEGTNINELMVEEGKAKPY